MPRYNTRLQAKLARTKPVVPVRKYNTRLQTKKDYLFETAQLKELMSRVPDEGDKYVQLNHCFEFLQTHHNLLKNYAYFRKTVEAKIDDFLANQIPLKMQSYGFYLIQPTELKQLIQLKSTLEKLKEIISKNMFN
jgi:hypothetical protein